jgi:hypothetical protein
MLQAAEEDEDAFVVPNSKKKAEKQAKNKAKLDAKAIVAEATARAENDVKVAKALDDAKNKKALVDAKNNADKAAEATNLAEIEASRTNKIVKSIATSVRECLEHPSNVAELNACIASIRTADIDAVSAAERYISTAATAKAAAEIYKTLTDAAAATKADKTIATEAATAVVTSNDIYIKARHIFETRVDARARRSNIIDVAVERYFRLAEMRRYPSIVLTASDPLSEDEFEHLDGVGDRS